MLAIIFFLEFLLHQLSLAIGYAKYFVCQIRLTALFVSQQFSTLSVEFEQLALPFAMDFLRNLFKKGFSIFSKDLFLKLPHQLELWDEDTPLWVFLNHLNVGSQIQCYTQDSKEETPKVEVWVCKHLSFLFRVMLRICVSFHGSAIWI